MTIFAVDGAACPCGGKAFFDALPKNCAGDDLAKRETSFTYPSVFVEQKSAAIHDWITALGGLYTHRFGGR